MPILEGRYLEQYPQHLLGKEIRSSDEDAPKRARFGYEVLGNFTKLSDFVERRLCAECVATTVPIAPMPTRAATRSDLAEFLLPPEGLDRDLFGETRRALSGASVLDR